MSECPEYYRVSDGRELWEFFRDECHPIITDYCLLDYSQCHALESACEYLYRAGVKDNNPENDVRKAFRLIDRIMSMEGNEDAKKMATGCIREVVGCVLLERARKIVANVPQADPYKTVWGTVDVRHTYAGPVNG